MEQTFTPAPWEVQKPNSDDHRRVIAPDQSGFDVCRLVRSANDAKLIAAAPDLFEACRLFDVAANMSVFDDSSNAALAKAHDAAKVALAKARGQ